MSASLVLVWGLLLTHRCLGDEAVFVREGNDVTLDCFVADAMNIWMVSWEIFDKSQDWKSFSVCLLYKWLQPCPFEQGELIYRNKTLHYHSGMTFSNDISLTSRLTFLNVTAGMRHAIIECILDEMHNSTSTITTQKAYYLNVYMLPTTAFCIASINKDSDVSITCSVSRVYPKMTCAISVEFAKGLNSLASHPQVSQMLESVNISYDKYRIAGYTYYDVSCNAKYAPVEEGNYRFHSKIYVTKNFSLMSVESNWITVNAQVSEHQKLKRRNEQNNMGLRNDHDSADEKSRVDTSKAFYLLLGAIMVLGLTGIIALLWMVWFRCRKMYALSDTDYTNKSNIYETIESETILSLLESAPQPGSQNESLDERAIGALSSGVHSDDNDYSSVHNLLRSTYDNQTIALLRQCIATLRSNPDNNEYITPCTPELTSRGSVNISVHTPCTPELTSQRSENTCVHTRCNSELTSQGSVNASVHTPCKPELTSQGSVNASDLS